MRLIDADEFNRVLCAAQAECKKNGGNFWYGALSTVRENLANSSTIAAIPLDWLLQKAQQPVVTDANPFGFVLETWKMEQESRE